jgi:hypothetical protein
MSQRIRVALLMLLLVVGATSAMALPEYEMFITYYTDGTFQTECGYRHIFCDGSFIHSGRVTDHYIAIVIAPC